MTASMYIRRADTFWRRLRGLAFTRSLSPDEGLLLMPCNGVHMLGMNYALDLVYLDDTGRILKIVPRLSPWLGLSYCYKASMTLELAAGSACRYGWRVGDRLEIKGQRVYWPQNGEELERKKLCFSKTNDTL